MNLPKKLDVSKKKRKQKKSPEAEFQQEWQRVQNLQKQIKQLKQSLQQTLDTVSTGVQASEKEKLESYKLLCERLIGFVSKKSIPDYLREQLIEWIATLLLNIEANIFVKDISTEALKELMDKQLHQLDLNEEEKHRKKLLKKGFSEEQIEDMQALTKQANEAMQAKLRGEESEIPPEIEDMFDELFGDFEDDTADDPFGFESDPFGSEEEAFFQQQFEREKEHSKQKENDLSKLLKATPINQLFRKISRAIHPDLETDDTKKPQKHEQMAQLTEARDQKDIPTILNMYIEHVGELPEGLFQGNFEKLTKILKYQSEKLRQEKSFIKEEDPQKHWVYENFYDKNEKAMQRKITAYTLENKATIDGIAFALQKITSIKNLRPILEDRYEQMFLGDNEYI